MTSGFHARGCGCPVCRDPGAIQGLGEASDTVQGDGPIATNLIDALLPGPFSRWNWSAPYGTAVTLTFSFMEEAPAAATDTERASFAPLNEAARTAARSVLRQAAGIAHVTFTEVADSERADVRFGMSSQSGSSGYTYLPGGTRGGEVFLNRDYAANLTPSVGTAGYSVLLHETGHALGLKHPGNYNTTGTMVGPFLPADQDTTQYTVMSYNAAPSDLHPSSYMPYDIAALQHLYGAATDTRSGDDTYSFATAAEALTIWDGGGTDTFDLFNQTAGARVDLTAGAFSSIGTRNGTLARQNVAVADGVVIENAVGGAGADSIQGNDADNALRGGKGDDSLLGGAGADTLEGGAGTDQLTGGAGDDLFLVTRGAGSDTITDAAAGDRIRVAGLALAGTVTAGDGAALGRGQVQAEAAGGTTVLHLGADTVPGDDIQVRLTGSVALARLALSGGDVVIGAMPAPSTSVEVGTGTGGGGGGGSTTPPPVESPPATSPASVEAALLDAAAARGITDPSIAAGLAEFVGMAPVSVRTAAPTGPEVLSGDAATVLLLDGRGTPADVPVKVDGVGYLTLVGHLLVTGGAGANVIIGDADTQTILAGAGADSVRAGGGNDVLYGNAGGDALNGNMGNDTLFGGHDDDTVLGGRDDDVEFGNVGADVMNGNMGRDTLYGGRGADSLFGGHDDDWLSGDHGDDTLHGGQGSDIFVFGTGVGADTVADFHPLEGDRIRLQGVGYEVAQSAGGDALLNLSDGGRVLLMGVSAAAVSPDWFVV